MNKKIFTIIAALLFLTSTAFGVASNRVYYHIDIVDEFMQTITSPAITQVNVQDESGNAVAVYSTKSGTTEVGSTGVITSDLDDGRTEFWYGDTAIDVTVTDGTRTYEIESYSVRTARFMLPSFLISTSGNALGQTDDMDFTYGSWIIDGDTANRLDMIPDNDGGVLGIGDGTTQADVYIYGATGDYVFFDEGGLTLNMVDIDLDLDDDADLSFGSDDDFTMDSDTAKTLDILSLVTDETAILNLGLDQAGIDLKLFGATASTYALWDASADELLLTLADLKISQGSQIEFIDVTDGLTDWTADMSTDEVLLFLPTETTDDQSYNIGNAANTSDFRLFGATASTVVYDASADRVTFDVYDVEINDTSNLYIGSDDEFAIDNSSETLRIIPSDTDDDFAMHLGSANNTMDLLLYGKTASELITWDASADSLTVVDDLTLFTVTGTTLPFHVNATGTVTGEAVKLETTDGQISLLADGGTYGDIVLDAEDDIFLTAAGDLTLAVTGTFDGGGATMNSFYSTTEVVAGTTDTLTNAQSGNMIIYTMTGGSCTVTLPEADAGTVGMWFFLVDGNAAAGNDLTIDPEGVGQINGDTAGHYIKCENDRDAEGILIFSTAADVWYTVALGSSTVWTEE